MTHDIHTLLAIAVFGAGFYVATVTTRPGAAQIVTDAFHQLPDAPARGSMCLPASLNIEDRRDPIAVVLGNS